MDQTSFDNFYIRKCAVRHLPLIMAGSVSTITLFGIVVLALGGSYSPRNFQLLVACNILVLGIAYLCHRMARRDSMPGVVACTLVFQAVTTLTIGYRAHLDHLGMDSVYYMSLLVLLLGTFVAPNRWILLASGIVVLVPVTAFGVSDPAALAHQNRHLAGYLLTSIAVSAVLFPLIQKVKWGAFRLLVESFERSTTDPLTGLANRMAWTQQVQERIGATSGTQPVFATVLYMDLNDLKKINDEFGHPAGDRVLVEIGDVLRRGLPTDAIISRFGGDEFVAFIPDRDSRDVAEIVAALHTSIRMNPKTQDHSIGIGIAEYRSPEPIDRALHLADLALLREKKDRRTRLSQAQTVIDSPGPVESMQVGLHRSQLPQAAADPG